MAGLFNYVSNHLAAVFFVAAILVIGFVFVFKTIYLQRQEAEDECLETERRQQEIESIRQEAEQMRQRSLRLEAERKEAERLETERKQQEAERLRLETEEKQRLKQSLPSCDEYWEFAMAEYRKFETYNCFNDPDEKIRTAIAEKVLKLTDGKNSEDDAIRQYKLFKELYIDSLPKKDKLKEFVLEKMLAWAY